MVAFCYQSEPHKPFPRLPAAKDRYLSARERAVEADGGIPKEKIEY